MKTERKRNLKGAVLFTVVSVLAIMIIFMTCTLAMSAAANRRARKTYSSSQSSYTARTAIDSILAAVGTDKNFSKAIRDLKLGNEMDVIVEINNPSMGSINNAKIKYVGTKKVFDPDENVNAWVERNLYTITADVTIGGETTTITSNVLQDPPQPPGGNGGGAAFLTYGGGLDIGTSTGSWGGSYFGMGDWASGEVSKNWQNDLKYIEWQGNSDPALDVEEKMTFLADKGYITGKTYRFQNDNDAEAPFVVNGNFEAVNKLSVYYTHNASGVDNPGMQIWGNLILTNDSFNQKISPRLEETLKPDSFTTIPYMYVDGEISVGTGINLGLYGSNGKTFPFNIFCGALLPQSEGTGGILGDAKSVLSLAGDLYCMDADKTSVIRNSGTALYKWTESIASGSNVPSNVGGNIYSKGNVILYGDNFTVQGDVCTEGDLIIMTTGADKKVNINGNVVVGGNLYVKGPNVLTIGSGSKLYCKSENNILKFDGLEQLTDTSPKVFKGKDPSTEYTSVSTVVNPIIFNVEEVDHGSWKQGESGRKIWADDLEKIVQFLKDNGVDDPQIEENKNEEDKVTSYTLKGTITEKQFKSFEHLLSYEYQSYTVVNYKKNSDENVLITEDEYKMLVSTYESDKKAFDYEHKSLLNQKFELTGTEKITLNGINNTSLDDFYANFRKTIYPECAERETLMGVKWPVKGIEHRVIQKPDDVTFDGKPTYTYSSPQIANIDETCTLTGTFDSPVKIKPTGNKEIYVRLLNVNFESPEVVVDERKVSSNTARIDVDETDGKVYFVLAGEVRSNYYYKDEKRETKLLKTVFDWMTEFNLDNVNEKPSPMPDVKKPGDVSGDITESIGLTGTWEKDINIKTPESGCIWVVLDNFSMRNGHKITVDDTGKGEVRFYIKGKCSLDAGGKQGGIIAKSFTDIQANNYFHIISKNGLKDQFVAGEYASYPVYEAPRIKVYSDKGAKLELSNGSMITGYVNAINLTVTMPTLYEDPTLVNKIIYDGQPLKNADPYINRVGVVGMMDVKSCSAINNWLLLYVDDSDATPQQIVDAEGRHTYSSVEYMAYAN